MTNLMQDIVAFHEKYELAYTDFPRHLPADLLEFRQKFLMEELEEYSEAAGELTRHLADNPSDTAYTTILLEKQLDALVDLVYVALGTAYLQGFDFNEAWRRVQDANMKKIRAASAADSKRGSTHDVVKPPGWEPPRHVDLVENHIHNGPRR